MSPFSSGVRSPSSRRHWSADVARLVAPGGKSDDRQPLARSKLLANAGPVRCVSPAGGRSISLAVWVSSPRRRPACPIEISTCFEVTSTVQTTVQDRIKGLIRWLQPFRRVPLRGRLRTPARAAQGIPRRGRRGPRRRRRSSPAARRRPGQSTNGDKVSVHDDNTVVSQRAGSFRHRGFRGRGRARSAGEVRGRDSSCRAVRAACRVAPTEPPRRSDLPPVPRRSPRRGAGAAPILALP